ncbi:MAG TPA: ATP synthase F1 subunit delta [Bacteroidetes bacterium]|nr:ATP synthase F1 subunit delta [Bacteroidota bacterium]
MNESKIAVRYSKALFLSAKEQGLVKEVREDMLFVLELSGMQDFRELIESPVIPDSRKRQIMTALFKENISDISFGLVTLTVNNNREAFLPGIARCYIDMADKYEGITKVTLRTPVAISRDNRDTVIDIVEKDLDTKADLKEIVDEELAGGYILKIEDLYVDASLKSQLRKIRKQLIKE